MRFFLATAILAQSLPLGASSAIQSSLDLTTNSEPFHRPLANLSELHQPDITSSSINLNEPEVRGRARRRLQNSQQKSTIIQAAPKSSVIRNSKTETAVSIDHKECEPDIGILGCGVSQYCVESDSSTLGGLCVSEESLQDLLRRRLQSGVFPPPSVCDPTSFDAENYDCSCENFDLGQGVGEFTCTVDEYTCKRDNLCGSSAVTHGISADRAFASYCYGFEKPYDIELCYTVDTERNCDISIQNESCAKCQIVDSVVHPVYGFIGYNCYEFDCTNTIAKLKGNNCVGNYVLDALNGITMPSSSPSTPLPSSLPSASPSQAPSLQPSFAPTVTASSNPTDVTSLLPSMGPSHAPSDFLSQYPSAMPSTIPSNPPSAAPSTSPTVTRSTIPTMLPSSDPSLQPSPVPSIAPTRVASGQPSLNPSDSPSIATEHPSVSPSFEPWNPSKEDKANRLRGQEMNSSGKFTRGCISVSLCISSAIVLVALW